MLSLHPLLADMPDPTSYAAMGWIIAGVFGIVGLANQGMELYRKMFPTKVPSDEERYASKIELNKLEADHKAEMRRIESRFSEWMAQTEAQHGQRMHLLSEWRDSMGQWQLNMERAMGHVETKADAALNRRPRQA
jgi:hypothetical protein